MANEGERPTSADKGKGKVVDVEQTDDNGAKAPVDSNKKDKKDGETQDGMSR